MASFNREFPDTDWYTFRIPGIATALRNIDRKTVLAANGKDGSYHEPSSPITVGGAGMVAAGLWSLAGPVTTDTNAHIVLGAGHSLDYLRILAGHTGASRSMSVPVLPTIPERYAFAYASASNNFAQIARFPGARSIIAITPHNRSTLTALRLRFKTTFAHAGLPEFPKFRVIRVSKSGVVQALHTSRSGAYRDDGFLDLPVSVANVAAYEAAGARQWSNTYVPDQFNVIDTSNYAYFVDFVEEDGAYAFTPNVTLVPGAGTDILRGEMTCASITLLAPQ